MMKTRIQEHRDRMLPAFSLAMMALWFGVLLAAVTLRLAWAGDARLLAVLPASVLTWWVFYDRAREFLRHAGEVHRLREHEVDE